MAAEDISLDPDEARKQIKEDKKALKREEIERRKEAKARAKEIAEREEDIDDGDAGGISAALVTIIIIIIWLAIIALLIKLDVGGFGSNVMSPLLKNVPVLNKILPEESTLGSEVDVTSGNESYGGFNSLEEAVVYINQLEAELEAAQSSTTSDDEYVKQLEAEVTRLKTFEDSQVEFEKIKNEFYNEVIYADNAPDVEEYQKYYEEIEPEKAAELYKQVVAQTETDEKMDDYVAAYTAMKPKEAAAILEAMTDDLDLAAKILENMDSQSRGQIMGAMDSDIAAKISKLMDPES